jgi:hypothetical protein
LLLSTFRFSKRSLPTKILHAFMASSMSVTCSTTSFLFYPKT